MTRLVLIAPLVLASAAQAGPGLWFVGSAPGIDRSSVRGLTSDGSMAVGTSYGPFPVNPGFTWTPGGGRYDFGLEKGMPITTEGLGISDQGFVVGTMNTGDPMVGRAYRWTGSGLPEDLGVLPGEVRSYGTGVSGDGKVVVGFNEHTQFTAAYGEAFRWTPQTGMKGLGYLYPDSEFSQANAVSRDGATIVGMSKTGPFGDEKAFIWTEAGGMKKLPDLPGGPFKATAATAVNADGSVAVGKSPSPGTGDNRAVRWINGDVENLGTAPGFLRSVAYAVDGSGNVVGGTTYDPLVRQAFVWTPGTGMALLADYLAGAGVHVPDEFRLEYVYAISGDGLTFAGEARNLTTNKRQGFVATVPAACSADCDSSGELDIDDFICFQTLFGLGDAKADCDGSAELDIDDFICFQTLFGLGCP